MLLFISFNTCSSEINKELLSAVQKGNLKQFKQLLSEGADPNYRDVNGDPRDRPVVMERASVLKDSSFLKLCLEFGADPNTLNGYKSGPVIIQAAKHSKLSNVKLLVKYGAKLNLHDKNGSTPLHTAIAVNNYDIAYFLVSSGASLKIKNKWGYTPIDLLERYGDAGIKKGSKYYEWYLKFVALVGKKNT